MDPNDRHKNQRRFIAAMKWLLEKVKMTLAFIAMTLALIAIMAWAFAASLMIEWFHPVFLAYRAVLRLIGVVTGG